MHRICAVALALVVSALLTAQDVPARGGGGSGGGSGGSGHGGGMSGSGQSSDMMRDSGGHETMPTMERKGMQWSSMQRERLRTCTSTADRVRNQAREMSRFAEGKGFNPSEAKRMQSRLHEEVRAMDREHSRFMEGMGTDQPAQVRDRVRSMNEVQDRVHQRMRDMDAELGKANPSRERIAEQSRAMEREMQEWRNQYREMEGE